MLSRALQGLGAALISPAALSIISTTFAEGAERARALGVWAAIAIGGSAVGLILGGVLTQYFSWPWIFFVNVPVGIVAFLLSLRLIPESRDVQEHRSYDLAGAATVTGGLMALVYAIVDAQSAGWASAKTLGFFALAVVLLAGFVVVELRTRAPLVRLSIFRIRSLLTANITMFLAISGIFAMFFFNTLYIQQVLGYGPLAAGLALLTQLPVHGSYVANVLPSILLSSLGMGAVFMSLTLVTKSRESMFNGEAVPVLRVGLP